MIDGARRQRYPASWDRGGVLRCPFCDAPETDRFELEGQRFVVFGCMFTPSFDPRTSEAEMAERLGREYGPQGPGYFRSMCDRLHLVVAGPAAGDAEATSPRSAG